MKSTVKTSRVLGVAFLIQSILPLLLNVLLFKPLVVSGDILQTMTNLVNNSLQVRIFVLGEMVSALGIIFLGVVLLVILRKENEIMALVGFSFYILEAVMIVVSRTNGFSLLSISQTAAASGNSTLLQPLASMLLDTMEFQYNLAMVPFACGAPFLYYLLFKSRVVPRALSLWGLITAVCPCLVAATATVLGYEVPFLFYLPYIPFEFVIGFWILIKGIRVESVEEK